MAHDDHHYEDDDVRVKEGINEKTVEAARGLESKNYSAGFLVVPANAALISSMSSFPSSTNAAASFCIT